MKQKKAGPNTLHAWGAILAWLCLGVISPCAQPVPTITPDNSSGGRVWVRAFEFTGHTAFTTEALAGVVSTFTHRALTIGELDDARRAVTLHYVSQGYVNSGAILESQSVENGVVVLKIIEGSLTEVRVRPEDNHLSAGYSRRRLLRAAGPPFHLPELERQLLLIKDNPNVSRVNAELEPGAIPGEAILDINVAERNPWHFALEARNDRPPSVGAELLEAMVSHQNVFGWSDPLDVRWGLLARDGRRARPSEFDNLGVTYRVPISASDMTLQLAYSRNNFAVVEEPFNALNIRSLSEAYAVTLRQPLLRSPTRELAVSIAADFKHSESSLLGAPFSFSPGAVNGETTVTTLRLAQEFVQRSQRDVLAIRSSINLGMDALGATRNGTARDGTFVSWLGQAQYVRRFGDSDAQLILSASSQVASDPLLSSEQFSIGGSSTVRGYRENQLVRDMGLIGSLEVRIPLMHGSQGQGLLQIAPFADFGKGWNVRTANPSPSDIYSVGLGLLCDPVKQVSAQLYWGQALRNVNSGQTGLQDLGIHFRLRVTFF